MGQDPAGSTIAAIKEAKAIAAADGRPLTHWRFSLAMLSTDIDARRWSMAPSGQMLPGLGNHSGQQQ